MLTWNDIREAKLGEEFESHDLDRCCRVVYGGVAWSGKRPGFAVVLAMSKRKDPETGSHEICLLDEFESHDMRRLIRQCGLLNSKYEPKRWPSDTTNDSAEELMAEMRGDVGFDISETDLTEMKPIYPYILTNLKELLDQKNRCLFLKNSKILNYMNDIEGGDVSGLVLGDYPAIEALAYAVIEMTRFVKSAGRLPSHTGGRGYDEWRPKTIDDLAYIGAVDDLDPDDEDEDWYHTRK